MATSITVSEVETMFACLKSACNATFTCAALRDFHFDRMHEPHEASYNPYPPCTNEALTASILELIEAENRLFKHPPRKPEPVREESFACLSADCKTTFTCVALRDFHYVRMHVSRCLSLLKWGEEEEKERETRRTGWECIKADCDAKFLTEETRDAHFERVHPKMCKAIRELQNDIVKCEKGEKDKRQTVKDDIKMQENTKPEKVVSKVASESNSDTSMKDSSVYIRSNIEASNDSSVCVFEADKCFDDVDNSSTELKIIITPSLETCEETRGKIKTDEIKVHTRPVIQHRLRLHIMMDRNALVNARASRWMNCEETKTETKEAEVEIKIYTRPVVQHRSRSQMMMDRNAMANPGASKWVSGDLRCNRKHGRQDLGVSVPV